MIRLAMKDWGWVLAIALVLVGFFGAGVFWITAQKTTGVTPPGIDTTTTTQVAAFGDAGYQATEEFCRDSLTKTTPLLIPDTNGYQMVREKQGVQESIVVFIDVKTNNIIRATYASGTNPPVNAVVTDGVRKCLQDTVKP